MLYDLHSRLCVVLVCFILIILICSWRQRTLRFQLRRAITLGFGIAYTITIVSLNGYVYVKGGRWWLYFAVLSVALNDAMAYFAGRLFGKHHLIGLSPNKTIEGFIGGCISNMIVGYLLAKFFLQGDFW